MPMEIKYLVVEKLDFMSRVSMKSTCHLNREIMDSTKCHIPRVRFGYKDGKCLIVIYTGIDAFLRMEIEKCGNGVVVYKTENSYYREDATRKFVPSTQVLHLGISILKALLVHERVFIKSMEYEIPKFDDDFQNLIMVTSIIRLMDGSKFRVQEVAVAGFEFTDLNQEIFVYDEVETIRIVAARLYTANFYPVVAHDFRNCDHFEKMRCYTLFCTDDPFDDSVKIMNKFSRLLKPKKTVPKWATFREPIGVSRKWDEGGPLSITSEGKYRVNPGPTDNWVNEMRQTMCGICSDRFFEEAEENFRHILDTDKCVIGNLCKQHADPFDYWYYQNLPHRYVQEPFWDGFISPDWEVQDPDYLKQEMMKDENQKRKISMKNQMTSSWGFKKPTKLEAITVRVKASKCSSRILKFFFNMVFLPILISFVFYALFM